MSPQTMTPVIKLGYQHWRHLSQWWLVKSSCLTKPGLFNEGRLTAVCPTCSIPRCFSDNALLFLSWAHSFMFIFLPGMTGTGHRLNGYHIYYFLNDLFQRGRLILSQPSPGTGCISIGHFLSRPSRFRLGRIPSILPGRVRSVSFLFPSQSAHIFISLALLHHYCLTLLASHKNFLMAGVMSYNHGYPLDLTVAQCRAGAQSLLTEYPILMLGMTIIATVIKAL